MKVSRSNAKRLLMTLTWLVVMVAGWAKTHTSAQAVMDKLSEADFYRAVDKLWEDHITWTHLYIVSDTADLKDKDLVMERLIQNQDDIGTLIKAFYGYDAGSKLTALLKDHILDTIAVLNAAKSGNATQLEATKAQWYANGDEIATALSAVNPKEWPLNSMKKQIKIYLDLTLQEAQDRVAENYAQDVKDYDRVHDQILEISDMLSEGIIHQFPEKFSVED